MNFTTLEVILIAAVILMYMAAACFAHRMNWYKNRYEEAEAALSHARRELVKSITEK